MSNYKKGGYEKKYQIRKIIGLVGGRFKTKAVDPEADYFVLRLDKDPHAKVALLQYAISVRKDNQQFSDDIMNRLKKLYNYPP